MDYKEKVIAILNSKELSKEQKEKLEYIFPELKESEDDNIKSCIGMILTDAPENRFNDFNTSLKECLAWLEKQGKNNMGISEATKQELEDNLNKALEKETPESWNEFLEKQGEPAKLSEEEQNKFAKGVLTSCALSFINYLDAHKYKGKMCVSNGECEDIENAFHNAMWDRLHRYYCKYIEKQGEQKSVPKFKVGDTIIKKHNSDIHDFGSFTITDITGGKYWYNDRIICDITEQDEWELYEPVRQKSAWSEEDKMMLQYAIEHFERQKRKKRNCIEGSGRKKAMQEFIDWLKSLEPQSQWKPSDEQMNALREAVIEMGKSVSRCSIEEFHEIESLYNDLKKLKG